MKVNSLNYPAVFLNRAKIIGKCNRYSSSCACVTSKISPSAMYHLEMDISVKFMIPSKPEHDIAIWMSPIMREQYSLFQSSID